MKKLFTVFNNFIVTLTQGMTTCGFIRGGIDMSLQFKGGFNLFLLNHRMWVNATEEGSCDLTSHDARKLNLMSRISDVMSVHVQATAVSLVEVLNDRSVCHTNASENLVSDMQTLGFLPASNADIPFTVKKPSSVVVIHGSLQGLNGMMANSEKTRCPARKGAEGQPRAKQGALVPPGVCNEQVPSAEAKICSGLHGDMQRLAEMTSPTFMYFITASTSRLVTACNTKYLHWRPHARRNMVPLDPDRFSVNQDAMIRLMGWAGNMTLSNAFLQGVLTA
jgi:hypothetical protein